jgi:hypothetical protein
VRRQQLCFLRAWHWQAVLKAPQVLLGQRAVPAPKAKPAPLGLPAPPALPDLLGLLGLVDRQDQKRSKVAGDMSASDERPGRRKARPSRLPLLNANHADVSAPEGVPAPI